MITTLMVMSLRTTALRSKVTRPGSAAEAAVEDLQVGAAGPAHGHLDQHLVRTRDRDLTLGDPDVPRPEQHRRAHADHHNPGRSIAK
jgi:hypothetical protein